MRIVLIVLVLVAIGAALYFVPPMLEQAPAEGPSAPTTKVEPPPKKDRPQPKATAKPKPVKATLLIADIDGVFVNGRPAQAEQKFPAGKVAVTAYREGRYDHQLVELNQGQTQTLSPKLKQAQASEGWTTYQGNNHRTGFVKASARQSLTPRWQVSLGQKVESSPIVVGERAFLSAEDSLVLAVDLAAGKVQWQAETLGSEITPIAGEKFVFAGSNTGNFIAFQMEKGRNRGEAYLNSTISSLGLISQDAFLVTTRENKVFSVKTKKNWRGRLPLKPNWEADLPELARGSSAPLISGEIAVFHTEAAGPVAISLKDGRKLWAAAASGADGQVLQTTGQMQLSLANDKRFLTPTPAANGSVIYFAADKGIRAHQIKDGGLVWHNPVPHRASSSLTLAYDMILFGTEEGHLVAVSTIDGSLIYDVTLGSRPVFASPVVFDGQVLVAGDNGTLQLRNAMSGSLIAESNALAGAPLYSTPAVTGKGIIAVNRKGEMACFQ